MNTKQTTSRTSKGFTLVELIVVLAIFIFITLVVVFRYRNNDYQVTHEGYVNALATSIREAQTNAIGVAEYTKSDNTKTFNVGYGVMLSTETNQNKNTAYIAYAELPTINAGNGNLEYINIYNPPSGRFDICNRSDNCIERFAFKKDYIIASITGVLDNTHSPAPSPICNTYIGPYKQFTIFYQKATSTPVIMDNSYDILYGGTNNCFYRYIDVDINAPNGTSKRLHITADGAVQIQ